MTAAVIPANGEPVVVTPFFEAPSIKETLGIPASVRTWDEHENPMALVAGWLSERKLTARPLALEETVREFIRDGLQKAMPRAAIVSGAAQVRAVRMRKTVAELALMQVANTITLNAMAYAAGQIRAGMTPADIVALIVAATRKQGGEADGGLVLLGEAAAYPHGSHQKQEVREGEVILMDCGCQVHGYTSDISRTIVLGEPSAELRKVWSHVRQGQQIVMDTAKVGVECGVVDDAVRRHYESLGYGPGYKLPGLSHRTGHGIGMDGHEPVNLVHLERTKMDVGMCFSNEPGIYLPGKFGVRLEDCFYITADGPRLFSGLSRGIDPAEAFN
ncbi:MAG: M24 family metallopeptidase [Novosphingobium sp.]